MERLTIAVDCDDVVVESVPAIISWYNERFGTSVQSSDFYGKDLAPWGVTEDDEAIERVNQYLRTEEYASLLPIREAVEALGRLSERHELHLITGRADFLETVTRQWIIEHFEGIFRSLEFTNYVVPSGLKHISRSKADVCRQLGVDLMIDDHLHHARLVAQAGIAVLLFGDYAWNQSAEPLPDGIERVVDWPAVEKYVERYGRG